MMDTRTYDQGRVLDRIIAWARKNERRLSTAFFIFGFIDHLVTFGAFPLRIEIIIFEAYLGFAALCTLVAHYSHSKEGRFLRGVAVAAPLFAQLTIGGILAGFVVFYTKESVVSISWPFLLLLTAIFFGNELFRNYREHLIFQTVLLYFSLYALAIFALPVFVGSIGERIFFESTIACILLFALYLAVLWMLGKERLRSTFVHIFLSCTVLTALIVFAYVKDVIPPLPLSLTQGGVYQLVTRSGDEYTAQTEGKRSWYDIRAQVIHHAEGTPLYAYSAVAAPGSFSTNIVHEWQQYDKSSDTWKSRATIVFTLSGGREEGYRGYSMKYNPAPGSWRVLVRTINGQTIGKIRFDVETVPTSPTVFAESL